MYSGTWLPHVWQTPNRIYLMVNLLVITAILSLALGAQVHTFGKHYNFDSRNRPSKYTIPNVPYHQQITDYACGNFFESLVT